MLDMTDILMSRGVFQTLLDYISSVFFCYLPVLCIIVNRRIAFFGEASLTALERGRFFSLLERSARTETILFKDKNGCFLIIYFVI